VHKNNAMIRSTLGVSMLLLLTSIMPASTYKLTLFTNLLIPASVWIVQTPFEQTPFGQTFEINLKNASVRS
jgi:hypothetical protein